MHSVASAKKPGSIRYYSDVLRHMAIKSVMSRNKRPKELIFSSYITGRQHLVIGLCVSEN